MAHPRIVRTVMRSLLAACGAACALGAAETPSWALLDPDADGVEGTRTERAYADAELALQPPAEPIIVAVIDSGVDIAHPDLKDALWSNPGERTGKPGVDDDGNGFVDDVHGWNFIGARDGARNLVAGRMEITRELVRLKTLVAAGQAPAGTEKRIRQLQAAYERERDQHAQQLQRALMRVTMADRVVALLEAQGLKDNSAAGIAAFEAKTPSALLLKKVFAQVNRDGEPIDRMREELSGALAAIDAQYGFDFDESAVIGDDPAKLDERGYGNAVVSVPQNAFHGTHVAGIIAATRGNGQGIRGQCAWARIMVVRVVPDGDERDKDVANGVRYAVDNGARIINMSFGKGISPDKAYVDAAFRHAEERGVLIVHGAGNSAEDNDRADNFPNRRQLPVAPAAAPRAAAADAAAGSSTAAATRDAPPAAEPEVREFANWIEVGASSEKAGSQLVANFSNYGATACDIFAPGTEIPSTVPGGEVSPADGTSMASPHVAGVAALVWSQHPSLTAVELKKALLDNARRHPDLKVIKPGTRGQKVAFSSLSVSGGIVDTWLTLKALAPKPAGGVETPAMVPAETPMDPAQPAVEPATLPADATQDPP